MLAICSSIRCLAPEPTAIIVMTALTPIMIPSMVNAERILLAISALRAIRTGKACHAVAASLRSPGFLIFLPLHSEDIRSQRAISTVSDIVMLI
jgi:hypothetical protein